MAVTIVEGIASIVNTCKKWVNVFNCEKCKKQRIGETIDFSHKWQIIDLASKIKKISSNIDKNFIEETNHLREDFDVQIIVQLENVPCDKDQARKRRKQFERYSQINLRTLAPYRLY